MYLFGEILLGVVFCIGGAVAQIPRQCNVPKQFQSNISEYDHANDKIRRFQEIYDALNRRIALVEEPATIIIPGMKLYVHLFLYNENITYTYDRQTHECTKSVPPSPMRQFGVPTNATFENEYTMGGPTEAFLAQEWSDRIPNRASERWIGVFTSHNCYPVSEVYITDNDVTHTTTITFRDTMLGIRDSSIFVPPRECLQAKYVKENNVPWVHFL